MSDLTTYYHNKTPAMSRRIITPYYDGPSKDFLESLTADMDQDGLASGGDGSQRKNKSKKRRSRQKSLSEEVEKVRSQKRDRQISVSSDISVKSEEESLDNILELLATSPEESGDTKV